MYPLTTETLHTSSTTSSSVGATLRVITRCFILVLADSTQPTHPLRSCSSHTPVVKQRCSPPCRRTQLSGTFPMRSEHLLVLNVTKNHQHLLSLPQQFGPSQNRLKGPDNGAFFVRRCLSFWGGGLTFAPWVVARCRGDSVTMVQGMKTRGCVSWTFWVMGFLLERRVRTYRARSVYVVIKISLSPSDQRRTSLWTRWFCLLDVISLL